MKIKAADGYSSVAVLSVLLLVSVLSLGAALLIQTTHIFEKKYLSRVESEQFLRGEAYKILDQLIADPSPEADSLFDPVWDGVNHPENVDVTLTLEDISSGFNLNFIRTKWFDVTDLSSLLSPGRTDEDILLRRDEIGFSMDYTSDYEDYIDPEYLKEYFTSWSYANFNVIYEIVLRDLYQIHVSESGGGAFQDKIQRHIISGEMADYQMMRDIVGPSDLDKLYPLINTEPLMNINLMDPYILKVVLSYPYGDTPIENNANIAETILSARKSTELTTQRIMEMIPTKEKQDRIYQYLGPYTWFWRITASDTKGTYELIAARLPHGYETDEEVRTYRILASRYTLAEESEEKK